MNENFKGVMRMEIMLNEWKMYTKKIILKKIYDENINEKVIYFLKSYVLLKVEVLNNKMEILFRRKDETVKIIKRFEPSIDGSPWCFYWTFPKEFDILELERILDEFEFTSYFVDEEI
jgi:hypothetical protein